MNAAGIMFLGPNRSALFLKRGAGGDAPGMWAFPGGRTEDGETAEQTAIRETKEETGRAVAASSMSIHTRSITPAAVPSEAEQVVLPAGSASPDPMPTPAVALPTDPVDFTTFVTRVEEQFTPVLNEEHTAWAWASLDDPPQPLHPGCGVALARLTMNELGVARAMATDQLASPQVYENVTLFAMRITGTGVSFRPQLNEFVMRPPELYLNDEFLARCNGLQVIMQHPQGATLDSDEFGDRTIGSIFLPYIRGDEVWGIAKVYDDEAIRMIRDEDMKSTSPTVVFKGAVNTRLTLDDGRTVLVEGDPNLLDHVAVCPRGVWDKGGEAQGIAIADALPEDQPRRTALDSDKLRRLDHAVTLLNARVSNFASTRRADAKFGYKIPTVEQKGLPPKPTGLERMKARAALAAEGKKARAALAAEGKKADDEDGYWTIKYVIHNGVYRRLPDARFHSKSDAMRYIEKYHSRVTHKPVAPGEPLNGAKPDSHRRVA